MTKDYFFNSMDRVQAIQPQVNSSKSNGTESISEKDTLLRCSWAIKDGPWKKSSEYMVNKQRSTQR